MSDPKTDSVIPSVRDTITSAMSELGADGAGVTPDPGISEPSSAPEPAAAGPKVDATGRVHGSDGKFAPKTAAEQAAAPDAPSPTTEQQQPAAKDAAPAPEGPAVVPQHWSEKDKAWIAALPKEHQASVVNRFVDFERGITPKLQEAARLREAWSPVEQIFAPHMESLKRINQTPQSLIRYWAETEQTLAGPNVPAKVAVLQRIAQAYGIDPAAAFPQFQGVQQQPAQDQGYIDPQIQATVQPLLAEINGLKQQIANFGQFQHQTLAQQQAAAAQAEQQQLQSINGVVASFRNEVDDKGSPKYPYYARVEPVMEKLIRINAESGMAAGKSFGDVLKEAYDAAVWADPVIRSEMIQTQQAAVRTSQEAQARDKMLKAQRAALPLSGSSSLASPSPGRANGSVRGTIEAAMEMLSGNA